MTRKFVIKCEGYRRLKEHEIEEIHNTLGIETGEERFGYEVEGNFTVEDIIKITSLPYVERIGIEY